MFETEDDANGSITLVMIFPPNSSYFIVLISFGTIYVELILKKQNGSVDWIHLVQDRDQWLNLANTVMNLWVP